MPLIIEIKSGAESPSFIYQLHAQKQLCQELDRDVNFEPEGHIYTKGGVKIPSITQVLGLISNYDFVEDHYKEKGKYIHEATALMDIGDLDYGKTKYKKYITAWNKFMKEHDLKREKVYIETPLISKFGYAGTPDRYYPEVGGLKYQIWIVYLKPDGTFKVKEYKYKQSIFNEFLSLLSTHKLRVKLNIK